MSHVVIIGAGVGGLSAAIDLAAAGHHTTVVDPLPEPGGKANVAEHDGVRFDTGPSVLTLPSVFDDLFRRAGTRLEDAVGVTRLPIASRYRFPGGDHVDLHAEAEATRHSITSAFGAQAGRELDEFLAYAARIWGAAAPHFVEGDAPTPARMLQLGFTALRALPAIDPLRTMNRAIEARVRHPGLRWILARYATYNGSHPGRAPATLNCIAHVELGIGVHGVEGGIHALITALAGAALRLGATLELGVGATRILTRSGRVTGVELSDGRALGCDAVVCNADVAHLAADLLDDAVPHRLRPQPPSMSGWVGVFRAKRRTESARPAHEVLFPAHYPDEFRDIFDADRPPAEPTVYLCAQEKAHRRAGWSTEEPLFVMANAPAEPEGGRRPDATWRDLQDVVTARLRAADLIDGDDALCWQRTPTQLATTFPRTRGAIYGAASNSTFAAFRRPANRVATVPGLYLASGSAHPGGGLPLCALSGRAAARNLLSDLPPRRP